MNRFDVLCLFLQKKCVSHAGPMTYIVWNWTLEPWWRMWKGEDMWKWRFVKIRKGFAFDSVWLRLAPATERTSVVHGSVLVDHSHKILLGIHLKGWGVCFYRYKNQDPQEKHVFSIYNQDPQEEVNCTQSRPARFSLCEMLSKKRVYILHWVGWVGYRIKSPKLKHQKFKQI